MKWVDLFDEENMGMGSVYSSSRHNDSDLQLGHVLRKGAHMIINHIVVDFV